MRSTCFHRIPQILGALLCSLLFAGPHPAPAQGPGAQIQVSINPRQRLQMIDGFGVNFNGTYFRDAQKPMIDLLIDDLGATIFRLDPYGLLNWEVVLDDKAPPPQHRVCHQGALSKPAHLNPAMYREFAEEIVSMLLYARTKARIDFEYFSPLNETDCYPAEGPRVDPEEISKVLDAIAQRMKKEGLGDVKLVVADQAMVTNNYIGPILHADDLMKQVAVFSFHTYS